MLRRATALCLVATAGICHSATINVTNTNPSGGGSLRNAIQMANSNPDASNTINFNAGVTGTIQVAAGSPLFIDKPLTITGPGANNLTISGQRQNRIVWVHEGATSVNISDLTLANGKAKGGDGGNCGPSGLLGGPLVGGGGLGAGGAIFAWESTNITLTRCVLHNNLAMGGARGLQVLAGPTSGAGGGGMGGNGADGGAGNFPGGGGGGGIGDLGIATRATGGTPGGINQNGTPGRAGIISGGASGGSGGDTHVRVGGAGGANGGGGGGGGSSGALAVNTGGAGGGGGGLDGIQGEDGTVQVGEQFPGRGGDGGCGGGGGGGGYSATRDFVFMWNSGGQGGFGGGGGAGRFGGRGGFGGGTGNGPDGPSGPPGFGAGSGGAGMGGALFASPNLNITLNDCSISNGSVVGGNAGGQGLGSAAFLMENSTLTFNISSGLQILNDTIAGGVPGEEDDGIIKTGSGDLRLNGINTYAGGTCIINGAVEISNENNLGSGPVKLDPPNAGAMPTLRLFDTFFNFGRDIELTAHTGTISVANAPKEVSGTIFGPGRLRLDENNTITLSASNTYTGGTIFSDMVVAIANNNALSSGLVTMDPQSGADQPTIRFINPTDLLANNILITGFDGYFNANIGSREISGNISGPGGVVALGGGILTISGNNTFDGNLQINSNMTVRSGSNTAIPPTAPVIISGTLDVNDFDVTAGSVEGTGDVLLGSGQLTTGGNDLSTELSGSINGTGSVVKTGAGEWTLSGSSTYSGGTDIQGGAIAITQGTSLGTGPVTLNFNTLRFLNDLTLNNAIIANEQYGTLETDGNTATLSGQVSGNGGLQILDGGTVILGNNNTYAAGTLVEDDSTVAVTQPMSLGTGTLILDQGTLRFDTATAISNTIEVAGDSKIDVPVVMGETTGILFGDSNLEKKGSGLWLFTGDGGSYDGTTTVAEGELRVNSVIAGPVIVNEGATLSGIGEVGPGTIFGTVSPGASIGTLTFNGDTSFEPTCHYIAEVDATSSDLIVVNGTATLGGPVDIVALEQITCGSMHTILTSTQRVDEFDAVTVNKPMIIPSLLYTDTDVMILLDCDLTVLEGHCPSYNSINTVAAIIDAKTQKGDIGVVFTNLINLEQEGMLCPALDAISGSQYPTLALIESQGHALYGQALMRRLIECRCCSCLGGWVRPYAAFGSIQNNGNAAGIDYTTAGIATGVDYAMLSNWTLGFSGNYAYTETQFKEPGQGHVNAANFSLYGSAHCSNWYFDHVIAAGYLHSHVRRDIEFGEIDRSAHSSFDGWRLAAYGETGCCCTYCGINFSPIGFLQFGYMHNDGFEEDGADSINLHTKKFFYTSVLAGLGGRAIFHCGPLCLEGRARWQVELADTYADINLEFEGIPNQPFNIRGVSLDRNFALIGIGAHYGCFTFDYDLRINSSLINHDLSAGFNWNY